MKGRKKQYKHYPSEFGRHQLLLLKRRMTKKAYRNMCNSYRCALMLGRNYGTWTMKSKKHQNKNNRNFDWRDYGYDE